MKTTKAMLIGSLCVLLPLAGHAGLVNTVNTDTLSNLDVGWTWNPETAGSDSPSLLNWAANVSVLSTDGSNWDLQLDVRHDAIPHVGEGFPPLTTKNYSFSIASGFGVVINDTFDIVHPSLGDIDRYSFVLNRNVNPANTTMSLTAVHQIPEPSSMVLVGMSSGFLFFMRRLRL
jgi:hypothetical protein